MATDPMHAPTAMQRLFAEAKGQVSYADGEAFLLHVFWQAPSEAAASELLLALERCARATQRDTPCVPTYVFRRSAIDADLAGPAPTTIGEHRQLSDALKKVRVGMPRGAIDADLVRRGLDPALLDLDPASALPPPLQGQRPVQLEFTEVYLDEHAFMQHAGSRDYLDAYGVVMKGSLLNRPPTTVRLGTPPTDLVDKILGPILKEQVVPVGGGAQVWRRCTQAPTLAMLLSADVPAAAAIPPDLHRHCTTCVAFPHPLRAGTTRLLVMFAGVPAASALASVAALGPARGEAHVTSGDAGAVRAALDDAGLRAFAVNASPAVGYAVHNKAAELHATPAR